MDSKRGGEKNGLERQREAELKTEGDWKCVYNKQWRRKGWRQIDTEQKKHKKGSARGLIPSGAISDSLDIQEMCQTAPLGKFTTL